MWPSFEFIPFEVYELFHVFSSSYTINATKGGNVFYRSPRHLAHSTSSTRFRKAEGEEASQHPGRLKLTGKASAPGGSTSGMLSTASLLQFRSGPPHKTDISLDYLSPGPCLASLTLPVLRRQAHLGRHCDKLSQSNWGKTGKRFRPATCALRRGQRGQVRVRVSFGNTSFARHIHILFYFFQWQASRVGRRKEVTLPPAGHKQKGSSFRLVTVPHVPHGPMRSCERGRGGFSVLNLD